MQESTHEEICSKNTRTHSITELEHQELEGIVGGRDEGGECADFSTISVGITYRKNG